MRTEKRACPACGRLLDIARTCVDCREPFVISASAQAWFRSRKWVLPSRCPDCRARRRAVAEPVATDPRV